jgi:CheY-like chemotaxis protein
MPRNSILIIDDDPVIVKEITEALIARQYLATGETDPRRAVLRVRHEQFDVILLDIRMPAYSGFHVLMDIAAYSPRSLVIVMSASRDPDEVLECIGHCAVDFLQKPFGGLASVIQRIEVNLLRPRFQLPPALLREHLIKSLWENIEYGPPGGKGRHLEQLLQHLLASIPFFGDLLSNVKTETEEIDIEFINRGDDPFWRECGALILVECKNWSDQTGPVGSAEIDHFVKVLERRGRCKTGIFVSYSGFSAPFADICRIERINELVVVPVDKQRLADLVYTGDRRSVLEGLIRQALH